MDGRRKYRPGLLVLKCSYGVSVWISGVPGAYIIRAAGTGVFVMWDQGWHQCFLHRAGRSFGGFETGSGLGIGSIWVTGQEALFGPLILGLRYIGLAHFTG
jgi:hypothetical protein